MAALTTHIEKDHNIETETDTKMFDDFEEYRVWKNDFEAKTHSQFVQKCAPITTGNTRVYYNYCNRAGKYKPEGKGESQLKTQGTTKIGYQCSAYVKATEDLINGKVHVAYCSTHYNHNLQLAHLKIPYNTRLEIIKKLELGVTLDRVLDDIRDTCDGGINREHQVTRKDLHNIKHRYNIEGIVRHKNDLQSVQAWITEMETNTDIYNPILIYKIQGEKQNEHLDNFSDEDFLLCIQTEFQRDMAIEHGPNIVCVDATHGTNIYDFFLITILTMDEFGEGVPVGWMISNREDAMDLFTFFTAIKKACGNIAPQWFMSDDAEQYFNAWKGVFDTSQTRKLLCNWHVHRAWRRGINEHIKDKEDQIEVYHGLCVLLQERTEANFRVLLQQFLTHVYNTHQEFHAYFTTYYCSRLKEWATCYRKGCVVNTNMFVESFHRTLKIVSLNHKKNRRIDMLLITLIKVARSKAFEHFKKQEYEKVTHRISEIMKRHNVATNLSPNTITEVTPDKEWKVTSSSDRNEQYSVVKHDESDQCSCKILCRVCCICPHTYTCECMDALVHATVCKHQHLVHMNTYSIQVSNTCDTMDDGQTGNVNYYTKILFNQESRSKYHNKQKALILVEELRREIEKSDRDDLIQQAHASSHCSF